MSALAVSAPALSVIIATHNNKDVLARCLACWRRLAGARAVEIILVEDGCSDGTVELLGELQATPWGVQVLRVVQRKHRWKRHSRQTDR